MTGFEKISRDALMKKIIKMATSQGKVGINFSEFDGLFSTLRLKSALFRSFPSAGRSDVKVNSLGRVITSIPIFRFLPDFSLK